MKSTSSINTSESGVGFAMAFHSLFSIIPTDSITRYTTEEWHYPPDGHFFLKKPISLVTLF